ncbi:hypothetical protein I6A60_40375 [Frankia sp. AgB1.9]|nr:MULTISPECIES: hypothetical protein [unclassified Frankia]MBL7486683.1 hypothetical protein [Frankia sp. AgW1.1]MBL7554039.1 hypothetical protein [Frankia sp. AgB1.9]MBL7618918.1 hypothetical protein [Frankia sp. AgB1.8]
MKRAVRATIVALGVTLAVAGCDAVSAGPEHSGTGTPTPPTTSTASPAGPFALPASACDLVQASTVEQVTGRSSVTLTGAKAAPPGSTRALLTCTFSDGALPVGLLTVDSRPADAGKTAAQELDGSIAGSLYRSTDSHDVPGLGDAAKYGTAPSVDGLTYATVWTVELRGGGVGDLTVTLASRDPAAAREGIIGVAKSALATLDHQGG